MLIPFQLLACCVHCFVLLVQWSHHLPGFPCLAAKVSESVNVFELLSGNVMGLEKPVGELGESLPAPDMRELVLFSLN